MMMTVKVMMMVVGMGIVAVVDQLELVEGKVGVDGRRP